MHFLKALISFGMSANRFIKYGWEVVTTQGKQHLQPQSFDFLWPRKDNREIKTAKTFYSSWLVAIWKVILALQSHSPCPPIMPTK